MVTRVTFPQVPGEWVRATEYDALAAQVDRLNGIIEHAAPCVFHDNAHADCVQHSGQAPCMTQTEPEWLAEIQKERDALAAQNSKLRILGGRLRQHFKLFELIGSNARRHVLAWDDAEAEPPATCLASLKAEWAEKILETLPYKDLHTNNGDMRKDAHYRDGWNSFRDQLRRQAEEK